jgi:putative copper export protein/methionine-rich copper-binding protein CopC
MRDHCNYLVPVVPSRTGVPGRILRLLVAALAAMLGALVLAGSPAGAQPAGLERSDPEDGAELEQPPTQLTLTFDGPVSNANVAMTCDGDPFVEPDRGPTTLSADGRTVTVEIETPMRAGTCNVSWTTEQPSGEDGAQGELSFEVLASPTPAPGETVPGGTAPGDTTATTTPAADPTTDDDRDDGRGTSTLRNAADVSDGATWLGRVLSTLGLAILFGSFVLIVVAWPEGPEYILAVRFLRSVWILTFVGTLLLVIALSAAVNEESFGNGLNPATWLDLLDAGWAGRAAIARLVLVIATGWVVLRPERVIDPTTQLPALAIPTLAVATIGLARTGGDLAVLGVIAGIVHALAMAVWFGGVVLLARVVLAGPGEEDLVQAVRGFSRISGPAIVLTVVSGLVQLYRLDGASLFSEGHGRVLVVKTVFVAIMLFVGLTARQVAQQRLARAPDLTPPTADRLRRAFGTEAVIGLVVLGLSGWLMSFTPPKQPETWTDDYVVQEPFVDATSGLDLEVSLTPSRVGGNQLRVRVFEPQQDLAGLVVEFIPPAGSNEATVSQPIPLTGAGVAVSAADYLPLSVPGVWTMQVRATTPQGPMAPTQQTFSVATATGDEPTPGISPTPTQAPVTGSTPATTEPVVTTAPG